MDFFYNFYPNRILFSAFGLSIYWYGFLIFLSVLFSFFVFYKLAKKENIEKNNIFDIYFYTTLFGLIGARIVYIFYQLGYYISNPLEILKFWNGGMSIIGGIMFGSLTLYFICKKRNINLTKILNILPITLLVAQIIGRFGNYFNQELFGIPTSFFLKIPIDKINRPTQYSNSEFFTPLFFYEIFFNIILLIILFILLKRKNKNNLNTGIISKELKLKDFRKQMDSLVFIEKGGILFIYINYYFILRFILEFFRINEPKILFFSVNQALSLVILIAFNLYWFLKKK